MSAWWAYTTARAGEERDKQRERDKQSASAQMDLWTEEIAWQHSVLMLLYVRMPKTILTGLKISVFLVFLAAALAW